MLTLLLIVPLIGSLLLLPFSSNGQEETNSQKRRMRQIALATSLVNLIISLVL